jgi:PAS domain-containing protein
MYQNEKDYPLTADLREYILSELPCGICVAREDERLSILFANDNYYHMLGFSDAAEASEHGLRGSMDYVDAPTRAEMISRIAGLSEGQEQAIALEARILRSDGSSAWTESFTLRASKATQVMDLRVYGYNTTKTSRKELRVREEA